MGWETPAAWLRHPGVDRDLSEEVFEEGEAGAALGLPGGDFFLPMGLEAENFVKCAHAVGGGFGKTVEEEDEPLVDGVVLTHAGEAVVVFVAVALEVVGRGRARGP